MKEELIVSWLGKKQVRVFLHIIFWMVVVGFYTIFFGNRVTYHITFWYVILFLPITMATTYFLNYYLIPKYLFIGKYGKFILYLIYTFIISVYLEMMAVVLIFITVAKFKLRELHPSNVDVFILMTGMYVIVFLGAGIKLVRYWYDNQYEIQKLKQEKVEAELRFLKSQLNPHFLFNTLNNLYALTLEKSDMASKVVLKLSELLDYLLYKSKTDMVSINEELHHLENYIELEKLRFDKRLRISFHKEIGLEQVKLPPLLLITFVENSFKHGIVSHQKQSWINIDLIVHEEKVIFAVENSRNPYAKERKRMPGGIGLENLKNRLELIYKGNYTLQIEPGELSFKARLEIPTETTKS